MTSRLPISWFCSVLVIFGSGLGLTSVRGAGGPVLAWGYNSFGEADVPPGLGRAVSVASGSHFSMAVRENGTVAVWGDNPFGVRDVPPQATNVVSVTAKAMSCLALRRDGTVVAWGSAGMDVPLAATGVVAIATGAGHHLALRDDGALLAWGANEYGQCNVPPDATNIVAIEAGYTHSVALRSDGRVVAWGETESGRIQVPTEATNVIAISAGVDCNLAVRADGRVVGWGGLLGAPVEVTDAIAAAAGLWSGLVIRSNGEVVSWGRNDFGEINVPPALAPAFAASMGLYTGLGIQVTGPVSLLMQPRSRIVGEGDTVLFKVLAIGQVPISYQWRRNGVALLNQTGSSLLLSGVRTADAGAYDVVVGNAHNAVTSAAANLLVQATPPTITRQPESRVTSLGTGVELSVQAKGTLPLGIQWRMNGVDLPGETNFILGFAATDFADAGRYRAVVANSLGQAMTDEVALEVVPVYAWGTQAAGVLDLPSGLTNVIGLAAGRSHSLAVKSDGLIVGWGDNSFDESTPFAEATNVIAAAGGDRFSLVLRQDGSVRAWGNTTFPPEDATNITAVAAAREYGLLLRRDGTPYGWQVGNTLPMPDAATNLIAIAAGGWHQLGLRADGTVIGWGNNDHGQATPPNPALKTLAIAAGDVFSLGLRFDGTLAAWGGNWLGATQVPADATNIVAIAAGAEHAIALRDDGQVLVWGDSSAGQGAVPAALRYPSVIAAGGNHSLALVDVGELRFVREPVSQVMPAGERVALSAWAHGPGTTTYQWFKNGTPLSGATHAYLILSNPQEADTGAYTVIASNGQDSIASPTATLTINPRAPVFELQPISQLVLPGETVTFTASAKGSEPIRYQWRLDGIELPGATAPTLTVGDVQWTKTGNYDVVASNALGAVSSHSASITFQPTVDAFDLRVDEVVLAFALQADGKAVLGGDFNSVDGQFRRGLARLNPDGTLDPDFQPSVGGFSGTVYAVAVQPDDRILVGGRFTSLDGVNRINLARLQRDGSLDLDFNPTGLTGEPVFCLALQPDGRILVGGSFTSLGGYPRLNLARLNPDGTVDATFNPGVDGVVHSLVVLPDGRVLVGGGFSTLAGQPCASLGRLNVDGSYDFGFEGGTPGLVQSLALQADGRILVGGYFSELAGGPCNFLGRLHPHGEFDAEFRPEPNDAVVSLAVQSDGRILMAGGFNSVAGQSRFYLARLDGHGNLDPTFEPETDQAVHALALQADGRVLVGGRFTQCNGQPRTGMARLAATGPVLEDLTFDATAVTWSRDGTGPVVSWSTFEASTNGSAWFPLGTGQRRSYGWQLDGLNLPPDSSVRARGFLSGGYTSGSGWFVAAGAGRPVISRQPASGTNDFGTLATFTALAEGGLPLSFQWRKDGVALADNERIRGARTPTLMLQPVSGPDRGGYSVVIGNSQGSVTSVVAHLQVNDPVFITQPADQLTSPGQTVHFTAEVVGTAPLALQWRKNGFELPGATSPTFTLPSAQWTDGAEYTLTASNPWGESTSASALLAFPAGLDDFNPGANGTVYALAIDAGNKIVVGGDFTILGGQSHARIGRVNADGTVDAGFSASANGTVFCLTTLDEGGLLVGGQFTSIADQPRSGLARLDANGALDLVFQASVNGVVHALAHQPDGRIVVAGSFTSLCGVSRANLGRLHADGTLDPTFTAATDNAVHSMALQPDGRILVGGAFAALNGQPRYFLGRLHPDGTLDSGFAAAANDLVLGLKVQPDGRILVGGRFTQLNGETSSRLGRLEPDGVLDPAFRPSVDNTVYAFALQTDGRILVGGHFSSLNGANQAYLGRLKSDGRLDTTWLPRVVGGVNSLALKADGTALVGGQFTSIDGEPRPRLAQLTNTHPASAELTVHADQVAWHRSGASPEIDRVTYQVSWNGTDWTWLGAATRAGDSWSLSGVNLPANATLLARGFLFGGYRSGSGWFTESSTGPTAFTLHPLSRTNAAGSVATFRAVTAGASPVGYQWFHGGTALVDSAQIQGARTATLTLIGVLSSEAGSYQLVATNAAGGTLTTGANLTVQDPAITLQPSNLVRPAGSTATFSVQVTGTPPLAYQWHKDGMPLEESASVSGVHGENLWLVGILGAHAGEYSVRITNPNGVLQSRAALLTVIDPVITTQPADTQVNVGNAATFSVAVAGSHPLNYQWRKAGLAIPGATSPSLLLATTQPADAGLYDVMVSNTFGNVTSAVARLTLNQALVDPLNPAPDGRVTCLLPQTDGRILVAGQFLTLGGQSRAYLGRLNSDGSLDLDFDPKLNASVNALAIDNAGRIVVAGGFSTVAGQARAGLCRIHADGSLDNSFHPGVGGWISSLLVQPDGRIVVAGGLTSLGGLPCNGIGRLHPDGTRDSSFVASASPSVWCMALQPDGKILVGGLTTWLSGPSCRYIGRLHPDGRRDLEFTAEAGYFVYCLAVQSDGQILVGGDFTSLNAQACNRIARLNPDGTLDQAFGAGASGYVKSLALQSDGRIVVGGWFTQLGGQSRERAGRLNADGSLDVAFVPGANGEVSALAIQPDGSILAGGSFGMLAGQNRSNLARLAAWEPATNTLTLDGTVVTWRRGDSNAGFSRTTFEMSTDNTNWINLGPGIPIPGGWQVNGVSRPPSASLRARGFVTGGAANASTWFEEIRLQSLPSLPVILLHDGKFGFRSNHFGFSFAADAGQQVVVESSVDLDHWTALSTNVMASEPVYFHDAQSDPAGSRHYRLRTDPQP